MWDVSLIQTAPYNVEQRRISIICFYFDMNNFRQRWKQTVIFNDEFHSVGQRRNNFVLI